MKLKEIFIDWLTSSRYIKALETFRTEQRTDYITRLSEKDTIIRQQKVEIAALRSENEQMRLVLMPLGSPAGAMFAAKFQAQPKPAVEIPVPNSWDSELNKLLQEEEDGIRNGRRVQEHESGADDGA